MIYGGGVIRVQGLGLMVCGGFLEGRLCLGTIVFRDGCVLELSEDYLRPVKSVWKEYLKD